MILNFKADNDIVVRTPASRASWGEGLSSTLPSLQVFVQDRSGLSKKLWQQDPVFRKAIENAKPLLYKNIIKEWGSLRRKTDRALQNYAGRYLFRATPFGVLAGIGKLNKLTLDRELQLTPIGITATKVDENQEENTDDLRESSYVFINDLVLDDGCRCWVLSPNLDGTFRKQHSVRSTVLLRQIRDFASSPVTFCSLIKLVQEKTKADKKLSQTYLKGLLEVGILKIAKTKPIEETQFISFEGSKLNVLDRVKPSDDKAFDTRIDLSVNEFSEVLGELGILAEKAAESLSKYRLSVPENPHLAQYRSFLLDNYGESATVPLVTLFNPGVGIGAPNNYRAPGRMTPIPYNYRVSASSEEENKRSLRKLAQSSSKHLLEQRLSCYFDRGFETFSPINMDSKADIHGKLVFENGLAKLVLTETGCSPYPKARSRFHKLFDEETGPSENTWKNQLNRDGEYIRTYLVEYDPPTASSQYVSKTAHFPDGDYLFVGQGKKGGICLKDIAVRIFPDKLMLIDLRCGKEILFEQQSMLNPLAAPDIVRFLFDVSSERCLQPVAFSWMGLEEEFDYLPRIESKNVVLSRARWVFRFTSDATYENFKLWARTVELPSVGFDCSGDNLTPVALSDDESLRSVWERHAARRTDIIIVECIGNELNSQNPDPFLEYLVPVRCAISAGNNHSSRALGDASSKGKGSWSPQSSKSSLGIGQDLIWPSEKWARHDFYLNELYFDDALFCLKRAFKALEKTLQYDHVGWYFVRYGEGGDHLRIRCSLPLVVKGEAGDVQIDVHDFLLKSLRRSVVVKSSRISAYRPEYERYGSDSGGDSFHQAHVLSTALIFSTARDEVITQRAVNSIVLNSLYSYMENICSGAFIQLVNSIPGYLATKERKQRLRKHRQDIDKLLFSADSRYAAEQGRRASFSDNVLHVLAHMHLNRLGIKPHEEREILGMLTAAFSFYKKRNQVQE